MSQRETFMEVSHWQRQYWWRQGPAKYHDCALWDLTEYYWIWI